MEQDNAKTAGQSSGGTPSSDNIAGKEMPQSNQDKAKTEDQSSGTPGQEMSQSTPPAKAKAKKDDADKILSQLVTQDVIVLTGSPGTGKTWLAKQITKSAVHTRRFVYLSLWISLSLKQKQDKELSLLQSIARQLSIFNVGSVWEDGDYIDNEKNEKVPDKEQLKKEVKEKLKEKWGDMNNEAKKEKNEETDTFLLVVLDSEGDENIDDLRDIKKELLKELLPSDENCHIKFLITSRKHEEFKSDDRAAEIEVEPFSGHEAVDFLKKRVRNDVSDRPKFKTLCDDIAKRNKVLPAQIIMLSEALKNIAENGSESQDRAFDSVLEALKLARDDDATPFLRFAYQTLPEELIDFFWHSWNLLVKDGGVQYNELITHWMLEGHLDLADGIKKAYEKGYDVMMKLVDRGMLKMQEYNLIVLEESMLTLEDRDCREFFETSNLGLAGLLQDGESAEVFERMAPTDAMMKTVRFDKKGKSVSSLLIDGSRLSREEPEAFFQEKQGLKVLALFNPRMTSLPEPISRMKNLLLLVLRGCYLLDSVDSIKDLEALVVLEISGSPSLEEMKKDLFEKMTKLRSLNLTALGIQTLPNVSSLTDLRRLIIKNCRFLETLPRLVNLKEIEVIDLSGSCSLNKLQEKCFKSFKKLRFVDFSGTKIEKLPIVQTLENLTTLLVRGCYNLAGLRFMKHLPKLKVLDVSGGTRINEIFYDCFDDTDNLKILDLSETNIKFLPDSLGKHLCDLRLKGCSKLEKFLTTKGLSELQSLNLSYSFGLKKFPDDFFETLTSLQSLNLSNSKVECFPSLSKLQNLQHLLLKGCSFEKLPESKIFGSFKGLTNLVELDLSDCKSQAEQLPSLEDQKSLEVINLSGYKALSEIDASFEHMSGLQVLNLSETQISSLPTLCNQNNKLRSLVLKNCTKLQNAPDFGTLPQLEELDLRGTSSLKEIKAESLSHLTRLKTLRLSKTAFEAIQSHLGNLEQLEVLDLSGEAVESLPSLNCLTNLKQLLLRGCSSLKELPSLSQLEVLDLSGTKVTNLRDKISGLTNMKCLHLAEEVVEEFKDGKNVEVLPLEVKLDRCVISKPYEIPEGEKKPRLVVHGVELLKSLKENSKLLESTRHSIFSVRAQSKVEDDYDYDESRKHIFSDIYSNFRKFPYEPKDGESLEIHGFNEFPTDIEVLVEQAMYVLLVENGFLENLSDLKPDSLKNNRGCWLERCNNMKNIFTEADLGKWGTLEILWISNLTKLKSLYDDKVQSLSFESVKHLYIDCCPKLETVFPSGGIPKNLETLEITFCDNLKTLFGGKGSDNEEGDSKKEEVRTTNPEGQELQTKRSAKDKETTTEVPTRTKSSIDKEKDKQTASSAENDKKVEAPATSSTDKDKEVEEAASLSGKDKELEARAASSADKDKEVDAESSADKGKEVEAQAESSADKDKELDAASSADKGEEVEAQSASSANKDKEVEGASSANKGKEVEGKEVEEAASLSGKDKELEARAASSANKDKEVDAESSADKGKEVEGKEVEEAASLSGKDKELEARAASSADKNKEVDAESSADKGKEVEAQAESSADKDKELDAASSADKGQEVEAQSASSANKDKEVEGASSANKGKEVEGVSSADKDKKVEARAESLADNHVRENIMNWKDGEMQTTSGINLKHLHISYCPMLETVFSSGQVPKNLGVLRIKHCDKLESVFSQDCELPKLHTLHLSDLPALTSSSVRILKESYIKVRKVSGLKETTRADDSRNIN